jgi:hypothetical protein
MENALVIETFGDSLLRKPVLPINFRLLAGHIAGVF